MWSRSPYVQGSETEGAELKRSENALGGPLIQGLQLESS